MAFSKNKSLSLLPLLAFISMFLMLLKRVNSADSLSFSFKEFTADPEDLIFQGDTITGSNNVLQLTKVDSSGNPVGQSVGRVLYYAPVHLWESSELVSSFETTFTFSISSSVTNPGDGLAFFIASPDTTIPSKSSGENLGLFPSSSALVAVEFDTYPNNNVGDPSYKHIGIDINSITSKTTTKWNWQNGATATAQISYNSASKRLSVVASYPGTTPVTLSYDTDLLAILPQWVRVGFSASTGQQMQSNTLHSWSFTSTLQTNNQIQNKDMHLASI
uniref:Lectin-like protein n=1 Tax=Apios americana TaxID=185702 RepID=A0A060N4U6_9FABA|nr:lectin-like protein [Apios americana]